MCLFKPLAVLLFLLACFGTAQAQDTRILGFADVTTSVDADDGKTSFSLGEQDLFITSDVSDRISFLGETVFRYNASSPTGFAVSVERIIIKYNIKGNHNLLLGKHHTPINYWNDTYHHGRVFFPTIYRPTVFNDGLLPLHTLGASLQGLNLTSLNFGYDIMVGNGLSSGDQVDNDEAKSVTLAAHIKPVEGMRIGASAYIDRIAAGSKPHHGGTTVEKTIDQKIFTGSFAYFTPKFEVLAESSFIRNETDSLSANTLGSYVYAGVRVYKKWVAYGRYDNIRYEHQEMYFNPEDKDVFIGGLRYEFNYLAVAKLEFQHSRGKQLHFPNAEVNQINTITAQFAIGF